MVVKPSSFMAGVYFADRVKFGDLFPGPAKAARVAPIWIAVVRPIVAAADALTFIWPAYGAEAREAALAAIVAVLELRLIDVFF